MKKIKDVLLFICIFISFGSCKGQSSFGKEVLNFKQNILLPSVSGRIDHIDVNIARQIVYVGALGNNSLEVVDLKSRKTTRSVTGLDEPQGVVYIPQTNEVMVANGGNGTCVFFNANSFAKTADIHLGTDADDVRYDSISKKIFIGYGDGGIAIVDAIKHHKIADIKLPAHPEGFQLNEQLDQLFVNVPDAHEIDVIDVKTLSVTHKWKTTYNANFPMAIDAAHHTIFVGFRHPATLVAINADNGKTVSEAELVSDCDDLFFDKGTGKLYASGGGGYVNVFEFNNNALTKISNIPVRAGARTSLLIPSLHVFVLAERGSGNKDALLSVFDTDK